MAKILIAEYYEKPKRTSNKWRTDCVTLECLKKAAIEKLSDIHYSVSGKCVLISKHL